MQQQRGSGKTAVLVERMINKIINEKIDIDKILVVTFTNAAASEMRERILDAIYEKLDENPDDENLQRQITLLNMASICTIDSFCLEVVKSNFYELDNMSPNFRIADTPEIELLKEEVLEDMFEEKYVNEDSDFASLINIYTEYRDDTDLKEVIKKIYGYISSSPFPLKWLHEKVEMFNLKDQGLLGQDFKKTIWGHELLNDMYEEVQDDIIILNDAKQMLENDDELEVCFQIVKSDIEQLTTLKDNLHSWDSAFSVAQKITFTDWQKKRIKPEIKDEAKKIRDTATGKFKAKRDKIFLANSDQAIQDIYDMYVVLHKLEKLIIEFDTKFTNKKREKNIVDFSDVEHLALKILVKEDENGEITRTDIAKKYAEKFEEIAIDEYQDSNEVQEYILTSVSRGNNIFMVGDVKQSIYKFRQAMPELFLNKYKNYDKVKDGIETVKQAVEKQMIENNDETEELNDYAVAQQKIEGVKIQLFKNFRSRGNVLDFTNLIFENIMSEQLGDVDYTEEEYLNLGATDYQENDQNLKTEIDIIDTTGQTSEKETEIEYTTSYSSNDDDDGESGEESEKSEHLEDIEIEAKYIANKVQELIDSKFQIYDRKAKGFRDIHPRDIVILLRSTKNKAVIYEQELIKKNLPVFSDSTQEYLDTVEIETIMNLLKIIDNPIQDIPLVTVLRSPIGGLTDDDLVNIRLSDKYDNFYECMQKAKVNVQPELRAKIETFLNNIENWRKEQEYLALDEFIWKIYIDTGYYNYVGLMPNGVQRQANLKVLFERAKQYETASFKGLYNFINFIEKLKLGSGDLSSAKIIGENDDVVRIMSIHKSKGLEFPVVFLANTNKQFNKQEIRKSKVLLHQKYGIGVQHIDYDMQIRYDTLAKETVKSKIEIENISEEMRILYVALTRAKEKIYITAAGKDMPKKIDKLQKQVDIYKKEKGKINPIVLKKCESYLEWILMVYLYNKELTEKITECNVLGKEELGDILENQEDDEIKNIDIEELLGLKDFISEKQLAIEVQEMLEYKYPHLGETKLPTKMSVSEIKQRKMAEAEEKVEELENMEDAEKMENVEKVEVMADKNEVKLEKAENQLAKPKFLQDYTDKPLTGAEKGTIMHLCMQKLDITKNYDMHDIQEFIDNLEKSGIITQKEKDSIYVHKIYDFTKSSIWQELQAAKKIEREKPFYIQIPAREIYQEDIEGEILVQGVIDLYYINQKDELILLDYKTDFVKTEEQLIERYRIQLEIYKRALEKSLGRKVDKMCIYSLYLQKAIWE